MDEIFTRIFVFQHINFLIFVALIAFFAFPALRKVLAQKRSDFAKLLGEAQKAKQVAEEQQKILDDRLSQLDREIRQILDQAKDSAELEAKAILDNAQAVAHHIRTEAQNTAASELALARDIIRQEIMTQVIEQVENRLTTQTDESVKVRLLDQRIGEVKKVGLGGQTV